jgi:protein-L-isoaspartate(D-aspartate) O-methyltransferase
MTIFFPLARESSMGRKILLARLMTWLASGWLLGCTPQPAPSEVHWESLRNEMVSRQIEARGVRDPRVLTAMRTVPRHLFVPEPFRRVAYEDLPLPIGAGQTISQPYIVALMTELAQPEASDRALEVGTGSGYQAAVLAYLVRQVYSVEILESLGKEAAGRMRKLGYNNVTLKVGDGYAGWPEKAPFNLILITAAPERVPSALLEQLASGGRMVVPVGQEGGVQSLQLIRKNSDGSVTIKDVLPVRFVPLVHSP